MKMKIPTGPTIFLGHHRFPSDLLKKQPVDMLAIENGHLKIPPVTAWKNVAEGTPVDC
jgi:hypothetical protein